MYFYGFDMYYMIFVLPALVLALYAQFKVSGTFNKYSSVLNQRGLTGAQVARRILDMNGLKDVAVNPVSGKLTDHYNPSDNTVNLSESVYNSLSVAALGVAAHETGHAIQHAKSYAPLKIRTFIFPIVRIASSAALPLAVLGFAMSFDILIYTGIIMFAAVVLFQVITLPVEFNASRRALSMLEEYDILSQDEKKSAKKVLKTAALTYVASALTSMGNLLRLILISRNRRR